MPTVEMRLREDLRNYAVELRQLAYTLPLGVGEHDLLRLSDRMRDAAEQLVRKVKTGVEAPATRRSSGGGSTEKDPDIAALEQHLADILGLKVEIAHDGTSTGGTLSMRYSNLDQLDMLCQRLSGERI